jgi:diguanylate cyclase (GGDEF)-like protein/PAS domain S-box-containing protein
MEEDNNADEEMAINLPELKKAGNNLALLHILVNQSNDAIFLVNPDTGHFLYVNDMACNNLGYAREELLTMGVLDIEEQLREMSVWKQHVSEICGKGYVFFRGRHKRKDRTTFPVEMNIKFVALPKKNYIVAVARDISWREQTEHALKESERQLAEAQRVARLGSWEWNITTNKVTWSEEVYRLFGISPEEFDARYEAFLKFVHPEDREMLDRAVKQSVAEKKPYNIDARIVRPDGTPWIMYARGEVIYDEADNPILMRGVLQDITERKQAEAALRENEKLLRTIIDAEPECVKLLSRDGSLITMNPAGLAMIQADSLDLVKGQAVYMLVAPEYRDAFIKLTEDVFSGKPGTLEFKIIGLKGRQLWLETHAVPLRGEKGEVAFLLGITRDITERMRAEQAILESEEKYRSLVESTDDSIYVVDRNYRYLHMNKKHMARMGFLGDEYIGRAYSEFHEDWETRPFAKDVAKVFETGKSISREYKSKRDNKCFAQTLSPVKRDAGQIVAVTIISKDITERKNMEEKLRALSLTDELTGLYNRRGFFAYCDQILKLCKRQKKGAFLLYADLDNLKEINDIFGHPEGDKVLVETATIFEETFRESDIISRIGGDEFVVIPAGNTKDALELITTRLRQNIESHNAREACKHTLSISFGTSYYDPQSPCSIDELVTQAETLMYVQKRNKKH